MVLKYISNILANEFLFYIYFTVTKSLRETFYSRKVLGWLTISVVSVHDFVISLLMVGKGKAYSSWEHIWTESAH